MSNQQIAKIFEHVADLLEFQGANPFRIRAYRSGARIIKNLDRSVAQIIANDPSQLTRVDGIGKDLAAKCATLVETGRLPLLEQLREEIPSTVLALLRIPGLGPKKAALLHRQLGIENLNQLEAACHAGKVRELKGFAAKTELTILRGLDIAAAADQRIYWASADEIAGALTTHMEASPDVVRLELAGSYRRGKETIGDLDLLVVSQRPDSVMDHFAQFSSVQETLVRGNTKMSVRTEEGLQIDLRVVADQSFGAALQYFTGSKEHNVVLRGRAKQRGLKVNEYGVFRIDSQGQKEPEYVAGKSEQDVYAALDLPWFAPELREARHEFEWADANRLPDLITTNQIRGDLHMHTRATDGNATIEEMAKAAKARGLNYIAITDHSQRVSVAHGLNADQLRRQWEEIDQFNQRHADDTFRVLKGIECDILEAGGMDLSDEVLSEADWVLASLHFGQRQKREEITRRLLDALENPHVDAIAHPTGRILNRREAYEMDVDAVMETARQQGKLLELNANPARLDLDDLLCAKAQRLGLPVVIGSDAHSVAGLEVMRFGVLQARRGGLTAEDVANTRTVESLLALLNR